MALRLELFVTDVQRSLEFYRDVLGFSLVGSNADAQYHALRLGGVRIAIQHVGSLEPSHPLAKRGDKGLGVEIVLEVEDIQSTFEHVSASCEISSSLTLQAWGLRDFRVVDPDGYYWRLTETRDLASP